MANAFDYLLWRGDLTFTADGFNEVDGSIFAVLSYIDLGALSEKKHRLYGMMREYLPDRKYDSLKMGLVIPSKNINRIFCLAASTRRFSSVEVSDYEAYTSVDEMCQFAAVVFHLSSGEAVVTFRGTDDTLIGWREDCAMSYLDEIPAQRMALDYLLRVADKFPNKKLYVIGHSKGGNLATYSFAMAPDAVKARVVRVYSYDGPGLRQELASKMRESEYRDRFVFMVPQSALVGTMFERCNDYTVVKSVSRGTAQHDTFGWEVKGKFFLRMPSLSAMGKRNEEQFNQSIRDMSDGERAEVVDALFAVIDSTGASNLSELADGKLKAIGALMKNYGNVEKRKKDLIMGFVARLFDFRGSGTDV